MRSTAGPALSSARWAEDADGNRDWMRAMKRVWGDVEATEPDAAPAADFACALSQSRGPTMGRPRRSTGGST